MFINVIAGSKVYALPGGVVTCNTHIVEIVDTIKPLLRELIDHANKVCGTTSLFMCI